VTCPASAAMEMITRLPMMTLWPMCELARKLLCDPIRVYSPSPVALWIVTFSRTVLESPSSVQVMPPFHFRSWVYSPMVANG